MTNTTVSTAGGALPALSRHNLIDEVTGEVNVWALKGLARREAMQTWGEITPRSLRSSIREFAGMIPQLQCAWRIRRSLPVEMVAITAYGNAREGVRRSAF